MQINFSRSNPFRGTAGVQLAGSCLLGLWTIRRGLIVDASAWMAGFLTLFIAAVVSAFAWRHLRADPDRARFFINVAAFAGAVLSMVFSEDIVGFALGWFLSGQFLASLVGHLRGREDARLAAAECRRSFLVSDASLAAAIALIVWSTGTASLGKAMAVLPTVGIWVCAPIAALLLIAAVARCALPPFSRWLLGSLATPTPVSALMHGGFVNAGGLLLIRFAPAIEAVPAVRMAAIALGLFAAVYGLLMMSVRPDIKGTLAASTVSQMGFMIASCGLGFYAAALWHLAAHGLFKAWLFLTAGSRIGIEQNRPRAELTPVDASIVAAATLAAGGVAVAFTGEPQLPLLLAGTTAVAAILSTRSIPLLAMGSVMFVSVSSIIVELLRHAALASAKPLIPAAGQFAIAAVFLTLWALQQSRRSRALPRRLFVHLLNAATISPYQRGARA